MMEITVFDVGHGHCTFVKRDDGRTLLIDCGFNEVNNFRPSLFLARNGVTRLDGLLISNYDQDHIDDLQNLLRYIGAGNITTLWANRLITPQQLEVLKRSQCSQLSREMELLLEMLQPTTNYSPSPYGQSPNITDFPYGETFCLRYSEEFLRARDTNNLSVVTIIKHGLFSILFAGDIEEKGWHSLLQMSPALRAALPCVNVFVAAHHGRTNGYCPEVFETFGCRPDLVVISDREIQYETQEGNPYGRHSKGCSVNGRQRKVVTTRSDGHILITPSVTGTFTVRTTPILPESSSRPEVSWSSNPYSIFSSPEAAQSPATKASLSQLMDEMFGKNK